MDSDWDEVSCPSASRIVMDELLTSTVLFLGYPHLAASGSGYGPRRDGYAHTCGRHGLRHHSGAPLGSKYLRAYTYPVDGRLEVATDLPLLCRAGSPRSTDRIFSDIPLSGPIQPQTARFARYCSMTRVSSPLGPRTSIWRCGGALRCGMSGTHGVPDGDV